MRITENMNWPPNTLLSYKMAEHSAWYSGEPEILSNFYAGLDNNNMFGFSKSIGSKGMFWGRQIKNQNDILVHVPIAGDIAETSANFLFAESPTIKIEQAQEQNAAGGFKKSQELLDTILMESGFFRKILEGAEGCAAIGGIFIKVAYDEELSPYPIPVVMQADKAIPEFSFGILKAVTFWKVLEESTDTVKYRLLERYEKGKITYSLYKGTADKLGYECEFSEAEETAELDEEVETVDALLAVYIPNVLPNRIDRNSYLGRSDLQGIERLMDGLDETFSAWIRDIILAQAKMLIPESFLNLSSGSDSDSRYNLDQMIYKKLDIDPTIEGEKLTPMQFAIRADEFEKSALNLLERIITSAGYSPQSFGLNIAGRAESGTALSMRERKSFSTKGKKQNYWQDAIVKLINLMMLVYNDINLSNQIDLESNINVEFNDGITNNLGELANSVKLVSDAIAASVETKIRLLHSDWSEDQIQAEVKRIKEENNLEPMPNPDTTGNEILDNPDNTQKE